MKHILAVLVLGLALVYSLPAQDFMVNGALEIKQIAPTPMAQRDLTATYTGAVGSATRYYWISTVYPIGRMMLVGPVAVTGTAAIGGGNTVTLAWPAQQGATSYIVVFALTPSFPAIGTCVACSLTVAAPATTLLDNAVGYANFAGGGISPASSYIRVNNRDWATPQLQLGNTQQPTWTISPMNAVSMGTTATRFTNYPTTTSGDVVRFASSASPLAGAYINAVREDILANGGDGTGAIRGFDAVARVGTGGNLSEIYGGQGWIIHNGTGRVRDNVYGLLGYYQFDAGMAPTNYVAGVMGVLDPQVTLAGAVASGAVVGVVKRSSLALNGVQGAFLAMRDASGAGAGGSEGAAFRLHQFATDAIPEFDYGLDLYRNVAAGSPPIAVADIRMQYGGSIGDSVEVTAGGVAGITTIGNLAAGVPTGSGLALFPTLFADLPAVPTAPTIIMYCTDCTKATPCAGAGPGSLAVYTGAAWDCTF